MLHLLETYGGSYRIRVHFGATPDAQALDFVLGFAAHGFVAAEATDATPQEAYWANDLEDVLEGRADEFSPFCRQQFPVEAMRLWSCLATPLLQSDLVVKKVRLHFERARQGLCPGSWVMEMVAGT